MYSRSLARWSLPLVIFVSTSVAALGQQALQPLEQASVIFKINSPSERLEMTVHTSRILTMDQKIPQAQVNNPDILDLTPLSPTQIQVSAKTAGVTQINLWDESQKLHTVDVIVYGDVRELELMLQSAFPNAALKVTPVANSVMISGYVDKPEHVDRIIRVAEEYYPKVINNMTVGGVQQVLLHVKVMEVSRTKLRQLGFDWSKITGSNIVVSGPGGMLSDYSSSAETLPNVFRTASPSTFAFNIGSDTNLFYGVLEAMRQDKLVRILSEPTLVTISGRAASFKVGGQIPVPEPQSLGTISISWKDYGTQIDFVPIVLGNGKVRLEVRPKISDLDESRGYDINGTIVPGIKVREANTGVELTAGETLAIAGLVQTVVDAENSGLPWISELPYLGAAFRSVKENKNEVELLILVTPELVEGMSAEEAPTCGPGMQTTSPTDWELFMKGYLEVPNCCPDGNGDCKNGENGGAPPPDGMITQPGETIPAPQPSDSAKRPVRGGPNAVAKNASSQGGTPQNRDNRQNSSPSSPSTSPSPSVSQKGPPGMIGPVGYDVVR